jgi:beta-glucosidase
MTKAEIRPAPLSTELPPPTRRTFLGAVTAAVIPAACLGHEAGGVARADMPPARAAGTPAPDVEALLAQMTLDEKVGQMTQIDRSAIKGGGREIHDLCVGSVLSGADSLPRPNTADTWVDMYDGYQSQALSTRLGIPLVYGVDAVHGHGGLKGATIFPHHIGLGCTRSPELVQAVARVTAREVAGTGIDWTFGPCIAVPRDERWGRTYEGFGEVPELAESLGAAAVRGFQEAGAAAGTVDTSAIMACAKHFLADGSTFGGKDRGDARISEEELRRIHLPGYIAAIKANVATVMVSFSSWNGQPMHGNRHYITDVLKGELGFPGFVVTDWAAIDLMSPDYGQDIETAINAGIDMVMVPTPLERCREFISKLKGLVGSGRVPQARIDDAAASSSRRRALACGSGPSPIARSPRRSARPSIAPSRATPSARAWSCSRTTAAPSPCARTDGFTCAASAPTTWGSSAAAGRSAGADGAARSPRARRSARR